MGASFEKRKSYERAESRLSKGKLDFKFTALPHTVLTSVGYRKLSHAARSLLFDVAAQYNGRNNGKLVACAKYLKPLGWTSNDTVSRALKQLEEQGLLIKTRQGMSPPMAQASWYALGWFNLQVWDGLDFDPSSYRRSSFVTATSDPILKSKKRITPITSVVNQEIVPTIGIQNTSTVPKAGTVEVKIKQVIAPTTGDFIYLPSEPPQGAGDASTIIH